MRKITAGLFISLDGVVEDPQNWHFPYFNDEMGAAVDSQLATARHALAWPQDLRQLRRCLARPRGRRRGRRCHGQGAGRCTQDRRLESESPVQLAQLRAAEGRPR